MGFKDAFQRICVDLRTLDTVGKYGFYDFLHVIRLWIWDDDIEQAKIDLELN